MGSHDREVSLLTARRTPTVLLALTVVVTSAIVLAHTRTSTAGGTDISTLAGQRGSGGFAGDGLPAAQARLYKPGGQWVDAQGNVLIADTFNNRVRRVDYPSGTIETIAGNGTKGSSGDGGLAVDAALNFPIGLTTDAQGNVYVAEHEGFRIRRVEASTGIISTYAGNGKKDPVGEGGAATGAGLYYPWNLRFGPGGDLYIAVYGGHTIRKVDHTTGVITTVAGITTNDSGNFVSDKDGKVATATHFSRCNGFDFTRDGDLVFADNFANSVRKVDHVTGIVSTVAGGPANTQLGDGGPATRALIDQPTDVSIDDDGSLFISQQYGSRIRRVDPSGRISTVAGNGSVGYSGDGGPATKATLNAPVGVALKPPGDLYIADYSNNAVRVVPDLAHVRPVVDAVTPASGPSAGGNEATIHGLGFRGTTTVAFGSDPPITCDATGPCQFDATAPETTLHLVMPAHPPGTLPLTVTDGGGTSLANQSYTWNPPTVSALDPPDGLATGGQVLTLTGTDLQGASVDLGGAVATDASVNADGTTITATVPTSGKSGPVDVRATITASGASAPAPIPFTYKPAVSALLPDHGDMKGGTDVLVSGAGFANATGARFGDDAAASFVVVGPDQVAVKSPPHDFPEIVSVTVTAAGIDSKPSGAGSDLFSYGSDAAQPSVLNVGPAAASVSAQTPGNTGGGGNGPTSFGGGTGGGGGGGLGASPLPSAFGVPTPVGSPTAVPGGVVSSSSAGVVAPSPAPPVAVPGAVPAAPAVNVPAPVAHLGPGVAGAPGAGADAPRGAPEYQMVRAQQWPGFALATVALGACAFVATGAGRSRGSPRRRRRPGWATAR